MKPDTKILRWTETSRERASIRKLNAQHDWCILREESFIQKVHSTQPMQMLIPDSKVYNYILWSKQPSFITKLIYVT